MQQRVGLARAFATDAPILLMDEPFSALDPLIRTRLQDELLELQRNLERTIIFVSHDLDEAFKIGDRIAIMDGGRIVQCGTPAEIIRAPANGYVADFVANMNPLGVLTAADIMSPGGAAEGTPRVDADMRVQEVMIVLGTDATVQVMDGERVVGTICATDVVAALAPNEAAPRQAADPPAESTLHPPGPL